MNRHRSWGIHAVAAYRANVAAQGGRPDRVMIDAQTEGGQDTVDRIYEEASLRDQERQINAVVRGKMARGAF